MTIVETSDILSMIAQRLIGSHEIEILRLRAVCSSWRISVPPTGNSPFQVSFTKPIDNTFWDAKFPQSITQKSLLLISPLDNDSNSDSATPWIIQVVETGPKKLLVYDPFSSRFFPKNEHPRHINLLDYKVTEVHRSYNLRIPGFVDSYAFQYSNIGKVILVKDGITKADDDSFLMFALLRGGEVMVRKSESNEWIHRRVVDFSVRDMVRFKDKIYDVKDCGVVITIDLVTCKAENAPWPNQSMWTRGECYLAEFNGHLYLVNYILVVEGGKQVIKNLCAYVLNEENACWDRKYDLDGGVFIVGKDSMFSVLAKDFGRSNVIFFDALVRIKYRPRFRYKINRCGCSILYNLQSGKNTVYNWWTNRAPFWPPPNWFNKL